jgi:tRNA pseudouridine38-40 synthase
VRTIKLTLEYDGTDYVGWQVQPNGRSIQAELERALSKLLKEPVKVTGAGRTDSGVHARGQVASFTTARAVPLRAFVAGVSALLPRDIAVVDAEEREPGFDARRSARGKIYRYRIVNRPVRAPLERRWCWEIFRPLDVDAMSRAAGALVGRHDFSAFRASDCEAATTVREVRRLEVGREGERLVIEIEATAFLKHMVRNIVGTLAEVGLGKRQPGSVEQVLASRDRTLAGVTAPAHGLCLEKVFYEPVPAGGVDG